MAELVGVFNFLPQHDGDALELTDFYFFDNSDVPVDMTGNTPKIQVRRGSEKGKLMATYQVGSGLSWVDQAAGHLRWTGGNISWGHGDFYYDLEITYSGGDIKTHVKGMIRVNKQTTV